MYFLKSNLLTVPWEMNVLFLTPTNSCSSLFDKTLQSSLQNTTVLSVEYTDYIKSSITKGMTCLYHAAFTCESTITLVTLAYKEVEKKQAN